MKLELENVNTTDVDSKNYRKLVTKALHKENEKRLRKGSEAKEDKPDTAATSENIEGYRA